MQARVVKHLFLAPDCRTNSRLPQKAVRPEDKLILWNNNMLQSMACSFQLSWIPKRKILLTLDSIGYHYQDRYHPQKEEKPCNREKGQTVKAIPDKRFTPITSPSLASWKAGCQLPCTESAAELTCFGTSVVLEVRVDALALLCLLQNREHPVSYHAKTHPSPFPIQLFPFWEPTETSQAVFYHVLLITSSRLKKSPEL